MNDVEMIEEEFRTTDFVGQGEKNLYLVDSRTPTPDVVVVNMKASTSSATMSNDSKRTFVNDALPNPNDEPVISDSKFLSASMDAIKRQSDNAERDYRERGPSIVAENRNSTAQLFHKYCEDEERKRQESHKAKEAYHQPVSATPVVRTQDRKRRVTEMEEEWVKRQQQQQLNHWMGPPPVATAYHHQYQQQQQYMMMQQQQQQMPMTFPSTSSASATPSTPQEPNSCVNTPQQQQLNQSSPPSIANAPCQPSSISSTDFGSTALAASSPPNTIDDLSDLPTAGNVDFLAADPEFRCDKDEIKDLGPDIFDEFFSEMAMPSTSSPMGAPMFSSTPTPNSQAASATTVTTPGTTSSSTAGAGGRSYNVGFSEMEQQHQLQLQQQQQHLMLQQQQQQQREMFMKQQAMYSNGYGQAPTTAQQQQHHAQYIHHMRMQQMRFQQQQQQNAAMMDPRMMSYYQHQQQQQQQQQQMSSNGIVAPPHHPMYHHQQQLHHHHQQQFAPHPMN